jgi:NAD(P)-dependent dehydrogenase (short-subunit alcohol dehydrogenase family)
MPIALITGRSSGIGHAMVYVFNDDGQGVWATTREVEDVARVCPNSVNKPRSADCVSPSAVRGGGGVFLVLHGLPGKAHLIFRKKNALSR